MKRAAHLTSLIAFTGFVLLILMFGRLQTRVRRRNLYAW